MNLVFSASAALLAIAPLAAVPAAATQAESEAPQAATARTRANFNAGWRFQMGDVVGAQAPGFNDSDWETVGLPHSFGIPYFQSPDFPVGYGWYRKHLTVPPQWRGRRIFLEFEGAFQDAEIFVNGKAVGRHRGGYTGFSIDISDAATPGDNVVAVRVNNKWDARLAPRAGEHVFQGGLYRDVWLVTADPVHVTWYGTRVTTPGLSEASGKVAIETEIRNDGAKPARLSLRTEIIDAAGQSIAILDDKPRKIAPGATLTVSQMSRPIERPALWSPESPTLYRAVTTLCADGRAVDRYETPFGFRWIEWTADQGFFLNGRHRYLLGANVHQDQAGWGDAVTNGAMERDVRMMKEAGMDFIRGSHYPHDPHFTDATDRIGMFFWAEAPFWGIGGFGPDGNWLSSAYPVNPADRAGFDASVKQQLGEMIRIARNHPSVIAWSMGNETFFSAPEAMADVRRLLKEIVALTHELDPTRPAAVGGAQRGEIDHIGDIAGYNGDGAWMYPDPGVASMVSEYGSTITDRPGEYKPGWGDLEKLPGGKGVNGPYPWRYPWRAGEAIWAGFDHGSIAGRKFGSMGIVDYARLPKRGYYWYRNAYTHVPPPEWPQPGKPAALRLTASSGEIARADGTDDVQLVVTVLNAAGKAISNVPPVTLRIESGPGELPTGRAIRFAPDSNIPIRDGQAAIAMRSWQAGKTVIRATSPGLEDATIAIETKDGPAFVPGLTPLAPDRAYQETGEADSAKDSAPDQMFGTNNPTGVSSAAPGHPSRFANDGDPRTWWLAMAGDKSPWLSISPEKILQFRKVNIRFPKAANYRFVIEAEVKQGEWDIIADESATGSDAQSREIATRRVIGGNMRIRLTHVPDGAPAGIAEVQITGGM